MVKDILTKLWKDTCTVTVRKPYKLPNKSTGLKDIIIIQDEPCKLSFLSSFLSANPAVKNNGVASEKGQTIKLFISSDLEIPPGSEIAITHKKKTTLFTHSSVPATFTYHQEIVLELFEGWA